MDNCYLSAKELWKSFGDRPTELPQKGGQKDYSPNDSWLQAKRLEHFYKERQDVLGEERIKKKGQLDRRGEWCPKLGKVELTGKTGKFWGTVGHSKDGRNFLYPEEALALLEKGDMELYYGEIPLSVQEAYNTLLADRIPLEQYQVYNHLIRLGYAVFRHIPVEKFTSYEESLGRSRKMSRKQRRKRKAEKQNDSCNKEVKTDINQTVHSKDHEDGSSNNCQEPSGSNIVNQTVHSKDGSSNNCQEPSDSNINSACNHGHLNLDRVENENNIESVARDTIQNETNIESVAMDCEPTVPVSSTICDNKIHASTSDRDCPDSRHESASLDAPSNLADFRLRTDPFVPDGDEFSPLQYSDFSNIHFPTLSPDTFIPSFRFSIDTCLPDGVTLNPAKNIKTDSLHTSSDSDIMVTNVEGELDITTSRIKDISNITLPKVNVKSGRTGSKVRPTNWTEYKQMRCKQTENELLLKSPVGHLWEGDVQPLVRPSQALSTASVLDRLKIVPNINFDEDVRSYPSSSVSTVQLVYDVYSPDTSFSKTNRGKPAFRLCSLRQDEACPDLANLVDLAQQTMDGVPIQWAVVDNGDITFYAFHGVDLPQDISLH